MKIVKVVKKSDAYDFVSVKPIFEKEAKELVDKLNDFFKKKGLKCFYTLFGKLYYSDGYRMGLKFNGASTDNKGIPWYRWIQMLEDANIQTKNLIFKRESNPEICLKKTWRPESHRGAVSF